MFMSFLNLFSKKIQDNELFIRFTYRKDIKKLLPTTYYESDTGWGCMLRVTQMAIANLLFKKQGAKINTIAPLFWDNSQMPFSLQTLTALSQTIYPNKKQFQWYTPCEAGFILKAALEDFNLTYSVSVCNDNSIFLSQISREKENVVILVMSRIGLEKAEKQYLQTLTQMMDSRYFFCILGGTPRYAHLFMKHKDGYMGYLDPHQTRKCYEELQEVIDASQQNIGKLSWVKRQKISSSMCMMFVLKKQEIDNWWYELSELKSKFKESFYIYMDEKRPQMDSQDEIIQIIDLEQAIK